MHATRHIVARVAETNYQGVMNFYGSQSTAFIVPALGQRDKLATCEKTTSDQGTRCPDNFRKRASCRNSVLVLVETPCLIRSWGLSTFTFSHD
jgi:hypothetical protein